MREGQAKVLKKQEIDRLIILAGSQRHGLRNQCLILFSFLLGLRAKEMAALKIDDLVDSKGKVSEVFHLQSQQTKGNKGRAIYLTNKKLRKKLSDYLKTRENDLNRWLFSNQKEGHFDPNTLQQLFKRMYTKSGIEGASSHSGRRTFATNLISKGFDIKSVSVLMGHRSIQTTARYIQENPKMLGQMVAGL